MNPFNQPAAAQGLKGQLTKTVKAGQALAIGPAIVFLERIEGGKRAALRVAAGDADCRIVDAPGRDHQDLVAGCELAFRDCFSVGPVRIVITDVGQRDCVLTIVRGTLPRDWKVAVGGLKA